MNKETVANFFGNGNSWTLLVVHRKKRFTSFPSPAGMSLTKLRLGRNNSVMTSLFPPRESLVVTSRLGTGNSRTFFYGVGYLFCLSDVFVGGSCLLLVVDCRLSVVECWPLIVWYRWLWLLLVPGCRVMGVDCSASVVAHFFHLWMPCSVVHIVHHGHTLKYKHLLRYLRLPTVIVKTTFCIAVRRTEY